MRPRDLYDVINLFRNAKARRSVPLRQSDGTLDNRQKPSRLCFQDNIIDGGCH